MAGGVLVFQTECTMVIGAHPIPLGVGLRGRTRHQSFRGKAVDQMMPCHGAEPLPSLVQSLKTCKAPERDSQNRHGNHQGSDTELRNAQGAISERFPLILPLRARFAKILGHSYFAGSISAESAFWGRWQHGL